MLMYDYHATDDIRKSENKKTANFNLDGIKRSIFAAAILMVWMQLSCLDGSILSSF